MHSLITNRGCRIIALVGISKNSGKTSLLNHILAEFPRYRWGVMTTGIDGEIQDRVFKTPKPRLNLPSGTIFCCDDSTLEGHGSKISILHKATSSKRSLWIVQAESALETEIAGASSTKEQIQIAKQLGLLGADKVLIDGSLDRKSIALEDSVDAIFLCVGASFGDARTSITELKRLQLLRDISPAKLSKHSSLRLKESNNILYKNNHQWMNSGLSSIIGNSTEFSNLLVSEPQEIYIPGAFTEAMFAKHRKALAHSKTALIFRHPECIKLGYQSLLGFVKELSVQSLIQFKLKAFALNSWAVGSPDQDAEMFRSEIKLAFPNIDFLDIREL